VNDIPSCVSSNIRLYADYILIYRVVTHDTDSDELQKDLVSLQRWSDERLMSFNPQKCSFYLYIDKGSMAMVIYLQCAYSGM